LALVRHPKVVATPHLGAQTREAQERISTETAGMLLDALAGSFSVAAVNLPFRSSGGRIEPYLGLGETLGAMAGALLGAPPQQLQVDLRGLDDALHTPLAVAVVKGVLTPYLGEAVNYVNAERIAASRGIELVRSTHGAHSDYPHLVGVKLSGGGRSVEIEGALFGDRDPRVVRFAGFPLEFRPEGKLLVLENLDVPGVVGKIGSLIAEAGVNIADIHLARRAGTQEAMAVLRLDQDPPEELLTRLTALPEVRSARRVSLGRPQAGSQKD
jgi:D-3-phosphoglycerate dehydrogenase